MVNYDDLEELSNHALEIEALRVKLLTKKRKAEGTNFGLCKYMKDKLRKEARRRKQANELQDSKIAQELREGIAHQIETEKHHRRMFEENLQLNFNLLKFFDPHSNEPEFLKQNIYINNKK
jgi:hypothetical protein